MGRILATDIGITLSGNPILRGITMEISEGDFVGLIGPNGSGKSTFLRCIYRTLEPDQGAVYMDGRNIRELSHRSTARRMGVVGQHNELQFDFTVGDMVMMGRSPYKRFMEKDVQKDYNIVGEALEKVDMYPLRNRSYGTLSGGEKQRVILARALAQETDFLILDEPTNHLDIKHQLEFLDLVKKMNKTILFAVHDLNIALRYCNKIGVIESGELIDFGLAMDMITPRRIKDTFGVEAKVVKDACDQLFIHYTGVAKG